ncbi:MAG: TraX protein [Oscillospiraceae bacterium]|nr:TraX protein [Oscillospiraceae bacterium]MBQ9686006.1 TraX protein [Oscillospiraceae bacterium]
MEPEGSLIPAKYKVLSGSALKCIALITMIIDHIGVVLLKDSRIVLFGTGSGAFTLYTLMRKIGRLAFPLYCFLLVEGFLHTHDRKKYGLNLLLFALISELPWNLEHTGTLRYAAQNVFFTLFLGYVGLCCIEYFRQRPREQLASLLLLFLIALNLKADYGVTGFGFILMLYALRQQKILQALVGCCFLSSTWVGGLAFIPINLYNGERGFIRGKVLKYAFYAAYPLHILILYWIKKKTIGY